jgi:hypothetical protein
MIDHWVIQRTDLLACGYAILSKYTSALLGLEKGHRADNRTKRRSCFEAD